MKENDPNVLLEVDRLFCQYKNYLDYKKLYKTAIELSIISAMDLFKNSKTKEDREFYSKVIVVLKKKVKKPTVVDK